MPRTRESPRTHRLGRQPATLEEEAVDAARHLELAAPQIRGQQPVDPPGDRARGGAQPHALTEELDERPERHALHAGVDLEGLVPGPAHGGARLTAAVALHRELEHPRRRTARDLHLSIPRPEVQRMSVLARDQLDAQVLDLEPSAAAGRSRRSPALPSAGAPGLDWSLRASAFRPSRWVPGRTTTVRSCTSPGSSRPASSAAHRGRTRTRSISITTGEPGSGEMRTGPKLSRRLQSTSLWLPSSTPPSRAASAASTRSRSRVRTIVELSTEWSTVTALTSASATTAARWIHRLRRRARRARGGRGTGVRVHAELVGVEGAGRIGAGTAES